MSALSASKYVFATFLCIGYYLLNFLVRLLLTRWYLILSTFINSLPVIEQLFRNGIMIICILATYDLELIFVE